MTAKPVGFVTRSQAGLRNPRSISRAVTPSKGGVALHWAGPGLRVRSHVDCIGAWRGFQREHMVSKGWVDIAYNFGVCQHGYVFAGRGLGIRSAANGTNDANQRFLACCWIGGQGDGAPSANARDAIAWVIDNARRAGAGRAVKPHRKFVQTECPGDALAALAASLDGRSVPGPAAPGRGVVQALQEAVGVAQDGKWGPVTDRYLRAVRTGTQGVIRAVQAILGVKADGIWGPVTEHAYQAARAAHFGRY